MIIDRVNSWFYQINLSQKDVDQLEHVANMSGISVETFIHNAILAHLRHIEQLEKSADESAAKEKSDDKG